MYSQKAMKNIDNLEASLRHSIEILLNKKSFVDDD